MDTVLECKDIEKYYGNRSNVTKALDGVSFNVRQGEFVGVMGPSGSGKTTLLNCIATIDSVSAGFIHIGGRDITALAGNELARFRRDELGFIFQDSNLLDTLTAFENIALALTIAKAPASEIPARVQAAAAALQIGDALEKFPHQLSGGQKQRVAAARALIGNPTLILADEPTGALDSKSARRLLESFEALNAEVKATILMVTHDPFAASYCHRILFLRDGRLFNEIHRGDAPRKQFFDRIMEVVGFLGGETAEVL
ncbi:MAG: ABC transporter ATP-binding protein [Coriobacteriaceae bacterium]|jgi:putative ABC transport system ATP-binding protein|nr:ABC transporter ATP-binding protein [Coriobacteriaceae bacterium]